jgi:hypothetical protein
MSLVDLIDQIREDNSFEGTWDLGVSRTPTGIPPLVIGLARFQSYRGRTQAALIQELEDYAEEAGLSQLHYQVVDEESTVLVW